MGYIPKNDLSTVATTTRKIQEPNHAAATLLVSGSPAFHLLNTFMAPMMPTTAPMAYIRSQPVSKYPLTLLVASEIPALPSCAKSDREVSMLYTQRVKDSNRNLAKANFFGLCKLFMIFNFEYGCFLIGLIGQENDGIRSKAGQALRLKSGKERFP